MRLVAAVVLALTLWAAPAAAVPPQGDIPQQDDTVDVCVIVKSRDISDAKARRRCDRPDGYVQRFRKYDRWVIFVT